MEKKHEPDVMVAFFLGVAYAGSSKLSGIDLAAMVTARLSGETVPYSMAQFVFRVTDTVSGGLKILGKPTHETASKK